VVAPEEDVIFTVSYIQQQLALPNETGVVRLLFTTECKLKMTFIYVVA